MKLDLARPIAKVAVESERPVLPEEVLARAESAAARLGLRLEITTFCHGGVFWTARMSAEFRALIPGPLGVFRLAGKGPTEAQARASCAMEFVERFSLYRRLALRPADLECVDVRTGELLRIGMLGEFGDTKCVSSGWFPEDALLHSLHELIETRLGRSCLWKPHGLVDLGALLPELPAWVLDAVAVVRTPSDVPAFHHFTALKFPADGRFDARRRDRFLRVDDRLFVTPGDTSGHSPNSGGAAGLDPRRTAFRAINEIFQGDFVDATAGRRRARPPHVPAVPAEELRNHETDTITGDIRLILEQLGEDAFVGAIDLTDPDLGIPVVKVVSDWDPNASLASRQVMRLLFDGVD